MTKENKEEKECAAKGLQQWLTFTKPEGGRIAMWPAAIVGVEEFTKPQKVGLIPDLPRSDDKDVFIHSNDFESLVPVAESFESVLERTQEAWDQEETDEGN